MADLFISYARPDRARAEALASALEADGYSVWWDRHIEGGAEFSADIERQLLAARVVVVAWSEAARESPWVKDEAGVGREHGKLVAISFDAEAPPLGFRQYHAIDFSKWDDTAESKEYKSLVKAIDSRSRGEPGPAVANTSTSARKQPRSRRTWLWAALVLLIAMSYFAFTKVQNLNAPPAGVKQSIVAESEVPRVLVAAFKTSGSDPVLGDLSSALSESVASGLSRFSWLKVAAADTDQQESNAAYRLEGSMRRSGETLRLNIQLIKTTSGEQVWGNTYDRVFREDALLVLEDDLTANVVASVADSYGALIRDLSEPVIQKAPDEMTPYEAVLRHMIYRQRLGEEDHAITLEALQNAVRIDPGNADAWAALAAIYTEEYKHDYNQEPGSLDRALQAAQKALQLEPDNAYGSFVMAETYYFRQNPGAFKAAAEKAIELNPYDSDAMAMIGILFCYGGEWDRGLELTDRAMSLNPNHPGWYRFGKVFDELNRGDYQAALATAQRINLPLYFADPYVRALAHAYLGQQEQAQAAAQEFLAVWGSSDLRYFREIHLDRWFYAAPGLTDMTMQGLRMAGLDID